MWYSGSQSGLKVVLKAALALPENLLHMQILRPYHRPPGSETQGAPESAFYHALQMILMHAQVPEPMAEGKGQQTFPTKSQKGNIFGFVNKLLNSVFVALKPWQHMAWLYSSKTLFRETEIQISYNFHVSWNHSWSFC